MAASGRSDGSVIIDTRMNTGGFTTGMANMKKGFTGLSSSLGKIAKVIASVFAVRQLVNFGKEAIQLGSDLAEVQNVVDVTFGNISDEINEFAKNAIEQFGLSETAAKQYSSTMGAMLKSMGFTTREAADMSKTLTGLAGDMASFYNLDADEAFAKLRSGISGETEPLKQLGINLSVVNLEQYAMAQGITKSYNAMTEQEKALLRYNYILSVTSDAQGDFARTSDSWANQTRILTERFKALKATIGQGLINLFTPILKVINTLLGKLATVANAFKAFTELITGKKSSGTTSAASAGMTGGTMSDMSDGYSSATKGAEDYADATEDAADATKKADKANKTYLSGLDEIRRYSEDITEVTPAQKGDNGGSIDELPGTDEGADLGIDYGSLAEGETVIDEMNDKFEKMKDILSNIFQPFKDAWKNQGEGVVKSAKKLFQSLKDTISDIGKTWYNVWTSGTGQAYLESIFNYVRSVLDMIRSISDALRDAWNDNGTGYALIESYYTMWTNILNLLSAVHDSFSTVFSNGTGQDILSNILQIIRNVFDAVGNIAQRFLDAWNTAGLGTSIVQGIFDLLNIVLGTIQRMTGATAEWAATLDFTPLLTSINDLLIAIQPLAQNIGDGLAWFYENVLLPLAGFTIEEIIPRFFETLANVLTILNVILEALQPLFQWFWDSVLLPVAQWTGGVFLEIWDGINKALKKFAKWCKENPEIIQNVAVVIAAFFAAFELSSIITGVITTIQSLIGIISGGGGLAGVLSGIITTLGGPLTVAIAAAIAAGVLLYKNWDEVSEKAKKLWDDVLAPFAEFIKGAFLQAWEDYLKPALEYLGDTVLPGLVTTFKNLWDSVLVPFGEFLSSVFKPVFETLITVLEKLWKDIIIPLADVLKKTFKNAFETAFAIMNDTVIPAIGDVVKAMQDLWDNILVPVGNFIKDTFGPAFETVFGNISDIIHDFGEVLNDIIDLIRNVFAGDWEEAWGNIKQIFVDVFEGLIDLIKTPINAVIGVVNGAITAINKAIGGIESAVSFGPWEIPLPWGTKTIGFEAHFPRIDPVPTLAKGAVIPPNAPFAAVLGDQKNGTNIEAPLTTIEQAVTNALKKSGGGLQNVTIRIPVILDGRQVFEAVIDEGKMKQLVSGRNPFEMA